MIDTKMKMKNRHAFLFFVLLILYKPAGTNIFYYFKFDLLIPTKTKASFTSSSGYDKLNSLSAILAEKINEHYEKLFKQRAFNGCVLVAIGDKIIYENAWGYNDAKLKTPLTTHHLFQLASVTKIFTATAVLKLYERGQLNLNDYVQKYIPEFPYSDVTIQQLLNHTSGLPNYLHTMPDIGRQDTILSHQSVLQFLIQKKLRPEFKPGTRHKYCNTNYAILACLIEKISGISYSDFLKKEIFIPCNMSSTNTIYYIDIFDENTAISNEYISKKIPFYAGDFILGDKSIYSNVHDLFNFSQYFLNGKLLKDSLVQKMVTGVKTNRYGLLYGCGIRIKDYQDSTKTIWFHNGWWHGYRTSFQMRPKDKVIVIVLSNNTHKTTYYTHPIFEMIDEILYSNQTNPLLKQENSDILNE